MILLTGQPLMQGCTAVHARGTEPAQDQPGEVVRLAVMLIARLRGFARLPQPPELHETGNLAHSH
jgi:hypothetical protein